MRPSWGLTWATRGLGRIDGLAVMPGIPSVEEQERAVYASGRIDGLAVMPGIPSVEEQERAVYASGRIDGLAVMPGIPSVEEQERAVYASGRIDGLAVMPGIPSVEEQERAVYASGRIDGLAVMPGIPSVEEQERRDHVPVGIYQRLVDDGRLLVADNLRVVPPEILWDAIVDAWGYPAMIVCDRFRLNELRDVLGPSVPIEPRVTQWSSSSEDIRALRKHCQDGPFALVPGAAPLMITSLSKAGVQSDSSGNVRLIKKGFNNAGRDDVAAALVLVAGAFSRSPQPDAGEVERKPILV